MANLVVITGRLTKDIECKYTQQGMAVGASQMLISLLSQNFTFQGKSASLSTENSVNSY